jgi:ABC-type phosphate transport system substrate-binding protein
VVHSSNPVTTLTLAQITGILSGKITKWSEVGGADQPIVIVAAGSGDGVRSVVEGRLLSGASISAQVREMPNSTALDTVVEPWMATVLAWATDPNASTAASAVASPRRGIGRLLL